MNIPNFLSILRIGLIPLIIFSLFVYGWEVTLLLFLLASALDVLDGYFARKLNLVTKTGALLDSVGDKLMIVSIVTALTIKLNISLIYVIMILFRDLMVAAAVGFVKFFVRRKKRITFMAKRSGKNVTVLQFITIVGLLLLGLNQYIVYLIYLTFITSVWCLSDYWYEWKKKVSIKDIKIR